MKSLKYSVNKIEKIFKYSLNGIRFIGEDSIYFDGNINIGKHVAIQTWSEYPLGSGINTGYKPFLLIHDNVYIGNNCQISCLNKIEIHENVTLGDNVFVCDNLHGNGSEKEINIKPLERELISKGPIVIEKNVLIGRNTCVLANVRIGEGSIIGANSVVTHDVPPFTVAVGCPAKVIRKIK